MSELEELASRLGLRRTLTRRVDVLVALRDETKDFLFGNFSARVSGPGSGVGIRLQHSVGDDIF